MDKSRDELIALCKEKGVKGYSGRPKAYLIDLLTQFTNNPTQSTQPIRYIDLFCGLGAFHTAFTNFQCVMACDINETVRKIYKQNYNLEPKADIRQIKLNEIPDFEILCAGFPCQPFSIAGNGQGFEDKQKGNLFYDILKIIDHKQPPMCILENVKNLETHDGGNTYATIEKELKARGYLVTSKVLNATKYGSPQARQRIFIVATKDRPFTIPTPSKVIQTVSSVIDTTVQDDIDRTKYELKAKKTKKSEGKPHILYDVISKATKKGGRQGERVYSIDSVGITVCASSGGPGAKTGLYKVGDLVRRLTVKETLGLFGFPSTYNFTGISQEEALFCLGNSIVVQVIQAFVPNLLAWFANAPRNA
jgi:DNA (cytosine-5)-methyltransferase 1